MDRDVLDVDALHRLLDHVSDGGVTGVFFKGSTGEGVSLSYRLRRELIDRASAHVGGRVPILVGVSDTAFVESIGIASHAAEAGADAVVLTTPYYFPAGQTELLDYTRAIVRQMPLPTMLYNMPQMTKVPFAPPTVEALADEPKIVGIKDSGGEMAYFESLCNIRSKHRPDWSVLIGPEAWLDRAMEAGGDGGVCGGANLYPRLFRDAYDAIDRGDAKVAGRCMNRIERLQAIYAVGKYASRHIKATKCAASLLGLCRDLPADPFHAFKAPERARVAAVLQRVDDIDD